MTKTENFDDTFDVQLTCDNIPPEYSGYTLDINWADWPEPEYKQQVPVKAKSSVEVPPIITVPAGEAGSRLY